jgi:hypothetical protein
LARPGVASQLPCLERQSRSCRIFGNGRRGSLSASVGADQLRSIPTLEVTLVSSVVFTPVLAKQSKSFSLIDCISVGVDRMQRNFEPMRKHVETWQKSELTDVTAKVVFHRQGGLPQAVLSRADSKLQNTLPAACTTSTSSRNTRNSGRERSGVSRMRLPQKRLAEQRRRERLRAREGQAAEAGGPH